MLPELEQKKVKNRDLGLRLVKGRTRPQDKKIVL